jgi:hypothetical protein
MSDRETVQAVSTDRPLSPDLVDEGAADPEVAPGAGLQPLVDNIREIYRWRMDLLKSEVGLENRAKAICRREVGYNPNDPDKKKKAKKMREAQALFRSFTKKGAPRQERTTHAAKVCLPILKAEAFVKVERMKPQRKVEALVKQLPVWGWWDSVNGLGALGLAIIVAEAGNLSNYATPSRLWKRMGVGGAMDADGNFIPSRKYADKEKALLVGYNPHRRSGLWNVGDPLIKHKSYYQDLYRERKKYEVANSDKLPKKERRSKMHNHRRAQRYMEKRLLLHLWRAWRQSGPATQIISAPLPPSE